MSKTLNTTVKLFIRPSCIATFNTIYGIGKVKANRLNAFLLNHPTQVEFNKDFITLMQEPLGRQIINRLPLDIKLRLVISRNIKKKILIFCYQAYRLFQNLPTKGQRTKANAGTPSRLNPYLSLRINQAFYPVLAIAYKRRELLYNERFDELKAFNKALLEKEKMEKTDRKQKDKKSLQAHIKNQKNSKKTK
jgi:ribosomal protein S13